MGCGLDLSAPRPEPVALVPRVQAGNPLARRPEPPKPERAPRVSFDARLIAFGPYLGASLWGIVPGLGALQRGRRGLALALGAGLLLCGAVFVLAWTHPLQGLVVPALLSLVGTSILTEQRARLGRTSVIGQAPGVFLAVAMLLALYAVGAVGFEVAFPRVRLYESARLPGGHYLVHDVPAEGPALGELAVSGSMSWTLDPFDQGVDIAPIIALAGQRVESDGQGGVWVDDAPPVVPALNNGEPRPALIEEVPPGHVVLYLLDLRAVPVDALGGILYYRWLPQAERGPIPWPPGAQGETP